MLNLNENEILSIEEKLATQISQKKINKE